jgi:rhamnopyranosyl-N-acetylglucosaminyl-diphospho-decaprenol beta-1,3/1,4-galactofuranosyltransferase
MSTVCAVVVAYRRKQMIEVCLNGMLRQTRPPDHIVVVDNASGDGMLEFLRERFPTVEILPMTRNLGASGGFQVGVQRALELGYDWVWLLDDDCEAEPEALQKLLEGEQAYRQATQRETPLLCSKVSRPDGEYHLVGMPTLPIFAGRAFLNAFEHGFLQIRMCTFNSTLVRASVVRRVGPPLRDYFLSWEDMEFTARLTCDELGVLVPGSRVIHRTEGIRSPLRQYLDVRNGLWSLRTRSFGPLEKLRILSGLRHVAIRFYREHRGWAGVAPTLKGLWDGIWGRVRN